MSKINFRVLRIGILSSILFGTAACSDLFNFYDKDIAQILNTKVKPEQKLDRKVSVDGTVIKSVSFLEGGAYQLQDKTGTIWIFTENDLPEEGTAIEIKGNLRHKNITFEDRDLGELYILESERNYILTADIVPVSQPNE